ncbi:MAG: HlyD family efflux transporter periplasmic adaptor subunit [Pseudomonadota bacterium]
MLNLRQNAYLVVATAAAITAIAIATPPASQSIGSSNAVAQTTASTDTRNWSIAAPGLVEPLDGEIGLGVEIVGRVTKIAVTLGEVVRAGQVLVRLDDSDALARIQRTQADVEIRERDRDNVAATRRGRSRRRAADKLADAEAALFKARRALDRIYDTESGAKPSAEAIDTALKGIDEARANRATAQQELDDINALDATPLFSRSESALELARANHTLALQAYEKTRIRAETNGTILRINAKRGEVVSPQSPRPLVVIGDMTKLRVRAEVDERSVADVKGGQQAVIRSVAFDGSDFNATVSEISSALRPGRIGNSNPRGASNANVLEVMLDIDGETPLLPGMEVDVLFDGGAGEPDAPKQKPGSTTN